MTAPDEVPAFGVERLALVVTGSSSASAMPFWINWFRMSYPKLELTVVVTRSAQRFVTMPALAAGADQVLEDVWPDGEGKARHVELHEWAQAIIVYPSTLHFMARLALGLADSPALLAAQCATVPVVVTPSLPPGGLHSAAYQTHWAALSARPNVLLVPPNPALSMTTGRREAWSPPPMGEVVELLERHRLESESSADDVDQVGNIAAFLADRAGL